MSSDSLIRSLAQASFIKLPNVKQAASFAKLFKAGNNIINAGKGTRSILATMSKLANIAGAVHTGATLINKTVSAPAAKATYSQTGPTRSSSPASKKKVSAVVG